MHTYRRFASTASSTSRSASTSMSHHGHHGQAVHGHGHPAATSGMSRSSSTTGTESRALSITMPVSSSRGLGSPSSATTTRSPSTPYGTLSSSNLNLSPEYTSSDLHTIAESLLAHVTFGPYHIASSPVPSSHMHTLLAASQSSRNKENASGSSYASGASNGGYASNASTTSLSSSSTTSILGPSSRRQFEGKEGSHLQHRLANVTYPPIPALAPVLTPVLTPLASGTSSSASTPRSNHPRARFTIGPAEERGRGRRDANEGTRGRGLGRKSVGAGVSVSRREPSSSELWELEEDDERGRVGRADVRGRRGDVKVLQVLTQ